MTATVEITGMAALQRALDELPEKLQRNIMRSSLRMGAKVIQQRAYEMAPMKTGRLRESIRVSVRIRQGVPVATIKAGGGKGDVFYAHMVEFGTAGHLIKPRKARSLYFAGVFGESVQHPGAHAHPFMRPAFDSAAQAAIMAVALQVQKRLTKQGIDTPDLEAVEPS